MFKPTLLLLTLGISLSAAANPHIGFGLQIDHVSFVHDAGSDDANMASGILSIAPYEWLAAEMRMALNLSDVVDEYEHGARPGETRLALQAGGYLRATLPLADYVRLYALAGYQYSMLRVGTCHGYRFRYEDDFGYTYDSPCGSLRKSRNGPVYGGGIRLGSVSHGWFSLEATQMPRRNGFGFDTVSIGLGVGF